MKWLKTLYIGEQAQLTAKKVIRAAEKRLKSSFDTCCLITLSTYTQGQLDIMTVAESRNEIYGGREMTVLGLAKDREEAFGLVEQMSRDCLAATGGQELKAWFAGLPADRWTGWRGVSL